MHGLDHPDHYDAFYTEKIWAMIPEVYRTEDGLGPQQNVLREIIEVVAAQAAETRRSIDRLWEDQHIETCDDWAVPYIGDLVGHGSCPRPTRALAAWTWPRRCISGAGEARRVCSRSSCASSPAGESCSSRRFDGSLARRTGSTRFPSSSAA